MLYVGHFSFDGRETSGSTVDPRHSWFTCIVEAESVGSAVEKLRELITAAGGWFASFDSVDNVYLDDITEIKGVPNQGVLAHFTENYDDPPPSISTSLPGVPQEFCVSYGWGHGRGRR